MSLEKPKLIQDEKSRQLVTFIIFTCWLSFLVSIWAAFLLSSLSYLSFAVFWIIIVILLASLLGGTKKGER